MAVAADRSKGENISGYTGTSLVNAKVLSALWIQDLTVIQAHAGHLAVGGFLEELLLESMSAIAIAGKIYRPGVALFEFTADAMEV